MYIKKSKTEKEINSWLKREYDFLEKQIRTLEKIIDTNIENESDEQVFITITHD